MIPTTTGVTPYFNMAAAAQFNPYFQSIQIPAAYLPAVTCKSQNF